MTETTTFKQRLIECYNIAEADVLSTSEVFEIYQANFPRNVLEKVKNYDTLKAGIQQIKAEIGSILHSNNKEFTKLKDVNGRTVYMLIKTASDK